VSAFITVGVFSIGAVMKSPLLLLIQICEFRILPNQMYAPEHPASGQD